jgi:hypothetical protein
LGFAGAIVSLLRHNQIITIFGREFSRVNIFHAAIYVYLFYLGILWYYCGSRELDLLKKWLKPIQYVPQWPITHIAMVLGLGAFMGILLGVVAEIWIFSIFYLAYLIFDVFSWEVRRAEIKSAIDGARTTLKAIQERAEATKPQQRPEWVTIHETATDAIEEYYVKKPHIQRIVKVSILMAILTLTANLIRLSYFHRPLMDSFDIWGFLTNHISVDAMRETFYTFFLLIMIVHETILKRWRSGMEGKLNRLEVRFRQIKLEAELAKISV